MAQTIIPYSPSYSAAQTGASVGGFLGYGNPQAPTSASTAGAAGVSVLPTTYSTPTTSPGSVQGASTSASGTGSGTTNNNANILAALMGQKQNYLNQADAAGTQATSDLGGSILDYLAGYKQQQTDINRQAQQNELARIQGNRGVLEQVGQGVQSGGVQLANMGASNSSATDALARAYSILGRQQMTGVGEQYAEGQNAVSNKESDLQTTVGTQQRHDEKAKIDAVNQITNNAQNQLSTLNTQLAYASLPDRVNIEQEIASVKAHALAQLSSYDTTLASGVAGVQPTSQATNQAAATQLLAQGTAPDNAFSFSTLPPAQLQGTGPVASSLPIFTTPKKQTA